ncbi:MAG: hypothetical protein PHR96_01515 [Clostridia bacterium]|nr:hypothetical protein [Clostridia bacterium]
MGFCGIQLKFHISRIGQCPVKRTSQQVKQASKQFNGHSSNVCYYTMI